MTASSVQGYTDHVHYLNRQRGIHSGPAEGSSAPAVLPPSPDGDLPTAAEREASTRAALTAVAARQREHLFCSRTQAALETVSREFGLFLQYHAVDGRNTWSTCSDLEVLTFAEAHYLPSRSGRRGALAASTVASMFSYLRRSLTAHNRCGPWTGASGNPADSQTVRDYVASYTHTSQRAGVHEVSAVPLPEAVFTALLDHLDSELRNIALGLAPSCRLLDALLLARDAAAFTLLWHSCRRGQDVLHVAWPHIYSDLCGTPVSELWCTPEGISVVPDVLYIRPLQTKTEQTQRPETWVLRRAAAGRERYCAVNRLRYLFELCRLARFADFSSARVFVGFTSRTPGAISSNALAQRLQRGLQGLPPALGVGAGGRSYTLHSFRRGRLQHESALGMGSDELMSMAGMRTFSVLQRYLDVGRHLV